MKGDLTRVFGVASGVDSILPGRLASWLVVQRSALQSTVLGLRRAFISQPMEVPVPRRQLASYHELGERLSDLIICFGYGEPTPRTLHRPVEDVLREAA